MRTTLAIVLSVFVFSFCEGQKNISIGNDTAFHNLITVTGDGFLYKYVPNQIWINTNNISIHKLKFATIDSAYVEVDTIEDDGVCHYYLISNYYPDVTLAVYDSLGNGKLRKLAVQEFRFSNPPDLVCYVLNQKGDFKVTKKELNVARTVQARCDWGCEIYFPVLSFEMFAKVEGKWIHLMANGNDFTPDMKELFRKINNGDMVYIVNVKARYYNMKDMVEIKGVTITVQN